MADPTGRAVLIERITMEIYPPDEHGEHLVFTVQHPSTNPAHGAGLGHPLIIHTERIDCRAGLTGPLFTYLAGLLPRNPHGHVEISG